MGQYADAEWYKDKVAQWVAQYGAIPPPWVFAENSHPYSMRWRMGEGETLVMVFGEWWEQDNKSEEQRIAYFRRWPPPPRWISWMADAIWDLEPWNSDEFDYRPYFKKLSELGFQGVEDYERDLDDEKWLEMDD
jgi:hypothetical protein